MHDMHDDAEFVHEGDSSFIGICLRDDAHHHPFLLPDDLHLYLLETFRVSLLDRNRDFLANLARSLATTTDHL
jgi:hypothetical protein